MANGTNEAKDKRLGELISYFKNFEERWKGNNSTEIQFVKDAAEITNTVYWRYAENVVRPALAQEKSAIIQRYKIASNTELAIMLVSPIINSDKTLQKKQNAELAFFVATSFLIDWSEWDPKKFIELVSNDQEIKAFADEHITWLVLLDPKFYYPVFSNSQVWRLFSYLVKDRLNLSK